MAIKVQFNSKITTKNYKVGEFTPEVKSAFGALNYARNWDVLKEFNNVYDFFQYLTTNLTAFRFGIKTKSNDKKDALDECWGFALDLDAKPDEKKGIIGASIKRTKEFAKNYTHIFYYSPSGIPGKDDSPHRLILLFNTPQTIATTERYIKHFSMLLQGESICNDATRLWFPPLEYTLQFSECLLGKGIDEYELPLSNQIIKPKKIISNTTETGNNLSTNSISSQINKALTEKALELGFNKFLELLSIKDVAIIESKRKPESGTITGTPVQRFDIKPIGSDCKDRVTANLIDDILYFYDRRDGTAGYTGTFLKFLLKCTGETDISFKSQLDYAKEIFDILGLTYPQPEKKKIEASNLWYQFLSNNSESLIYIKNSQKYGWFNGKYWELYNPIELIDTIFINWSIAHYGIIKAAVIGQIKVNIAHITFDLIRTFKTQPFDRHLYGFQDGIFNVDTKEFLCFDNSYFIWSLSEWSYNNIDLDKGKKTFELLQVMISKIVNGDKGKQQNFIDGFSLLVLDQLWKTQSMIWMYGEGGSGKSTLANWLRDMLENSTDTGRVADLRSNEIFNSPHSLQKITQGTIINLSEFSFPSASDASFLKDLIASGATENSTKMRGGCAIPINEKYKNPYTAYWVGSIIASSQERPSKDCLLDSGWTRRINFFSFQKIKEKTDIFKEIDANLDNMFAYILNLSVDSIIERYNEYFRTPDIVSERIMEIELSPVAAYLEESTEISTDEVPIKVLYREFSHHKTDYGWPSNYNLSMINFEKYLTRYLSKFHNTTIYLNEHNVKVSKLKLKTVLAITTSNGGFSYK